MLGRLIRSSVKWGAIVCAFLLVSWPLPVCSQGTISVTKNEHEHVFKESLTFSLAAKSDHKITEAKLFYQVSGQTSTHKVVLEFESNTEVDLAHTEDMKDADNYQPPMITFTYWWVIEDDDGNRLKTDPISFVYTDTRYTWQVLEDELVRLYWHDQDQDFGQRFFDAAVSASKKLSQEFGVAPKDPVAVVIYNSHQELMSVLQESSSEWTGAVTFGRTGCIAIGLGPMSWMERVVPHELTHAVLYLVTKPPFGDIPRWLHEGLAMRSEGGLSSGEQAVLDEAIRADNLIALRTLNSAFPDQRERATLSYAESYSLIHFIVEEFGTEKLGELIAVFSEGAHYDDALMQVFGVDMDGMEDLWRAYIGAQPRTGTTRATPVPTVTMTPSPVPTRAAENKDTPVPTPTSTQNTVATLPTSTPTATMIVPTPTATEALGDEPAVPAPRGPCLGAVPALALLILFVLFFPRAVR